MSIAHTHEQTVPATTWTIDHGLGTFPVTDVVIMHEGVRQKILPLTVNYVDNNTIIVVFSEPQTGTVRLVGDHKFNLGGA